MGHHSQDRRPRGLSEGSCARRAGTPRDTIAAIATAIGRAGIGVVRVSGPKAADIARQVAGGVPVSRQASLRRLIDDAGNLIDTGIVLFFQAPASYTGEDVLELHAHGSQPVLEMLLDAVMQAGARLARPGEFTERAFMEGRLDLIQAEAVADLIDAGSRQAARAALASLRGDFSRRVNAVVTLLTAARAQLEASFDFADEELGLADDAVSVDALKSIESDLRATLMAARNGARLRDGLRVALVGAPNVGKSSIMNRLAGEPRAIVTSVPGTTRDVLREEVRIGGASIELLDTAGLHESADEVERMGMVRAKEHASRADLVLLVTEGGKSSHELLDGLEMSGDVVIVRNKVDLTSTPAGLHEGELHVSALTGAGFGELCDLIVRRASGQLAEGEFTARRRHLLALEVAMRAIERAQRLKRDGMGPELVAEELRLAQVELGGITGEVSSDDLLGEIFATFCIGK